MHGSLRDEYESYKRHVVPPEASMSQLRGTKTAFYAGAAALFKLMREPLPHSQSPVVRMGRLERELLRYVLSVAEGLRAEVTDSSKILEDSP